ncbi:hypothetical protein BVJ53_07780 [Lacticaseibacillus chiayiensis]|uniref:DUF3290 domain-containing protein n=1 Tax=Lacticaseibacillus chiayiensis TaxID=2100821 RepID=A0A4Q1TX42_9LACO|nr:DUF3290 family protein [Lacticaseibacillus chiayiensis]QVI35333.1 DUF3290 domain-containing protein [Lacticaseibacillus chiayiensis]RXT23539.1 hypothetical protein BVJ53_07780 [Lacticaseibacillus chiayiensis]UYN57114.1 DUF3290 domain-containing protein [Lacticaseibacillus chiayiensis]
MGMTFFAYSVLTHQDNWQNILRYSIIMIGALAIVAYLLYFLRHKRSNKYRDLLILVALIELLTIGIQIRDLQASRTATADSQAVATLLRSVATQKRVSVNQLYANSNTVHTGRLVVIGKSTKKMYTVTLNADNNSYQLTKTTLIVPQVQFVTK